MIPPGRGYGLIKYSTAAVWAQPCCQGPALVGSKPDACRSGPMLALVTGADSLAIQIFGARFLTGPRFGGSVMSSASPEGRSSMRLSSVELTGGYGGLVSLLPASAGGARPAGADGLPRSLRTYACLEDKQSTLDAT